VREVIAIIRHHSVRCLTELDSELRREEPCASRESCVHLPRESLLLELSVFHGRITLSPSPANGGSRVVAALDELRQGG
jgi:hypothetical protein